MAFGFIIQAAYANWSGGVDDCVKKKDHIPLVELTIKRLLETIRSNNLPAKVILVVPEQESAVDYYTKLSKQYSLDFFSGDNENVLQRLIDACTEFSIDSFARINGSYWYFQKDLFSGMARTQMDHAYDLLRVPVSYPKGLTVEFSTLSALKKLNEINRQIKGNPVSSPFAAMENHTGLFEVHEFTDIPELARDEIDRIRAGRKQYEPEQVEFDPSKMSQTGSIDYLRYQKALDYLRPEDNVLDIACGSGYGSHMLSTVCASVTGADYNQSMIDQCRNTYQNAGLRYELADVTNLVYDDESFDVAVSMETIEHVDERAYVSEISRVLKPHGRLILSTPQNEWGFTLVPWHVKEYGLQEIKDCLSTHFDIVKVHGINSHVISDTSELGDRMLVIAEKR